MCLWSNHISLYTNLGYLKVTALSQYLKKVTYILL